MEFASLLLNRFPRFFRTRGYFIFPRLRFDGRFIGGQSAASSPARLFGGLSGRANRGNRPLGGEFLFSDRLVAIIDALSAEFAASGGAARAGGAVDRRAASP